MGRSDDDIPRVVMSRHPSRETSVRTVAREAEMPHVAGSLIEADRCGPTLLRGVAGGIQMGSQAVVLAPTDGVGRDLKVRDSRHSAGM